MKVPKIAKVQIAPKLEKNGFWKTIEVKCTDLVLQTDTSYATDRSYNMTAMLTFIKEKLTSKWYW